MMNQTVFGGQETREVFGAEASGPNLHKLDFDWCDGSDCKPWKTSLIGQRRYARLHTLYQQRTKT